MTRVSTKNQVTLPVNAMRRAGFRPGDVLRAEVVGPGQLLLLRSGDPIRRYSGALTSVYQRRELDKIREAWG
jgi:bifunctional DNA-binding transcriptional regulator/antitoxin component of YhaV-PrlF toxin-antitoxin module